jgi:hypothetical protein
VTLDRAAEFKQRIEEMQSSTRVRVAPMESARVEGEGHEVSAVGDEAVKRRA